MGEVSIESLKQKIRNYSLISNKIRFEIMASLLTSSTIGTGNSHTFTELKNILKVDSPNLTYHLDVLSKNDLIRRREIRSSVFYDLTKEGRELLGHVGITEDLVKKIEKRL